MEISPYRLVLLLLWGVLFGVSAGVLNDGHRLIRTALGVRYDKGRYDRLYQRSLPFVGKPLSKPKEGKRRGIFLWCVMLLQDLVLFAYAALGTVLLNYYFNDGQLRIYTLVAVLVGFLIYFFTLGKLVTALSGLLVFVLRSTICVAFFLFFLPFRKIFRIFGEFIEKIREKVSKTIAIKRKTMYNMSRVKCLLKEADSGFLGRDGLLSDGSRQNSKGTKE